MLPLYYAQALTVGLTYLSLYFSFSAAPSGSGWGDVMDRIRPVGSWTCETCLVLNTAEMVKCPACETAKPSSMLNALQAPAPEKVLTTDQAVSTDQAFCRSKGK